MESRTGLFIVPRVGTSIARTLAVAMVLGAATVGHAGGPPEPCHYQGDWEFINFSDYFPEQHALAALNNAGQVAGTTRSFADAPSHDRIFRWDDGVIERLDFPGHLVSALAISESGIVLGTVRELTPTAPTLVLIWQPDGKLQKVIEPTIPFWPAGINDDLLVCGLTQDGLSGVVMDGNSGEMTLTALGPLPEEPVGTMGGLAINADGVVAGQEVVFVQKLGAYYERPYMWTARHGVVQLPLSAPLLGARAVAINALGDIVGTVIDDGSVRPGYWLAGAAAPIVFNPPVGYFTADATAVNVHRHIGVIAPNDFEQHTRAFIWTGSEYVDLNAEAGALMPGNAARITHLNDACEALIEATSGFNITARGILRPLPDLATLGDFNGDGVVDEADRALLCAALGTSTGQPGYLPAADFNSDDVIDHLDQQFFNGVLPPCAGDVVSSATFEPPADGMTDAADLAYLLGAWASGPSCADFVASRTFAPPPDGKVDGADLAYLLGAWGVCE